MKFVYRKVVGMAHHQFATRVDPTPGMESVEFSFLPEVRVYKSVCGCRSWYVAWLLWQYSYQFSCGHVQKMVDAANFRQAPVRPDLPPLN
jgi:hypothetical protein